MKKLLIVLLTAGMSAFLFACGSSSDSGTAVIPETTEAVTEAVTEKTELDMTPIDGYEYTAVVDFMGEDVVISYNMDEEAHTWEIAYSFNGNDVRGAGTYEPGGSFEINESNNDFLTVAMENVIWPTIGK